MKTIFKLTGIFVILILSNCTEPNKRKTISKETASNAARSETRREDELFVGKNFYSGDELNTYTFIRSNKIKENDSLTYSIYKRNDGTGYLFSMEKLVSNEDQELYKIIGLYKFSDYDSANHRVEVLNRGDGPSILFMNRDKILKRWEFVSNHL